MVCFLEDGIQEMDSKVSYSQINQNSCNLECFMYVQTDTIFTGCLYKYLPAQSCLCCMCC